MFKFVRAFGGLCPRRLTSSPATSSVRGFLGGWRGSTVVDPENFREVWAAKKDKILSEDGTKIDFGCNWYFGRGWTYNYLDASQILKVTDAHVASLLSNNVTSINVRGCENLTDEAIEAIAANCPKLTRLDAMNCRFTALPTDIGDRLPNLIYLDFEANDLTSLPRSIVKLTKLKELWLVGNPFQTPPKEIADKGIDAIRAYFEDLDKGSTTSKLLKVLLIGEGCAGKTTLRNAFAGRPDPREKDRTVHADIERVPLSDRLVLTIYDCGGQEEYLAGQLPYITNLALYLLVVEARYVADDYFEEKYFEEKLERFLVLLLARAPDAVILPVVSKVDEVSGDPELLCRRLEKKIEGWLEDMRRAAEKYKKAINSLRVQPRALAVSVDRPDTIQRLRDEIKMLTEQNPPLLRSVGQLIPTSYEAVLTLFGAIAKFGDDEPALQAIRDGAAEKLGETTEFSSTGSYRPKSKLLELWKQCCKEGLFDVLIDDPNGIFNAATELWEAQGVIFVDAGLVYFHPRFVVDIVSALVDHQLTVDIKDIAAFVKNSEELDETTDLRKLRDELRRFIERGEIVTWLLLSFLWRDLDLAKEHYSQVIEMLAASGVIFELESDENDALAVVPYRLPREPDPNARAMLWPGSPTVYQRELVLKFQLYQGCPAGLTERFVTDGHGFGTAIYSWFSGVVVKNRKGPMVCAERVGNDLYFKVRFDAQKKNEEVAAWQLLTVAKALVQSQIAERFPGLWYGTRLICEECLQAGTEPPEDFEWETTTPKEQVLPCGHFFRIGVDDDVDDERVRLRTQPSPPLFDGTTPLAPLDDTSNRNGIAGAFIFDKRFDQSPLPWSDYVTDESVPLPPPAVLIVTTADAELRAVLDGLEKVPEGYPNAVAAFPVKIGMLGGRVVAVCKTEQSSVGTALVVFALLSSDYLKKSVKLVFAVGFAWGAKPVSKGGDQRIGDVIVATKFIEAGHVRASEGDMEIRGTVKTSPLMSSVNSLLCGGWPSDSQTHFGEERIPDHRPTAHVGTVISLPTLLDDKEVTERLIRHPQVVPYKPIVGGEMELYQIVSAAGMPGVRCKDWILAKAICDFAGLDGAKDKGGQPLAAAAAVDFADWILRHDVIEYYLRDN